MFLAFCLRARIIGRLRRFLLQADKASLPLAGALEQLRCSR
jgi:hypothetical protein